MSQGIGWAYAVAGTAVASAVIAITASTVGFFDGANGAAPDGAPVASGQGLQNAATAPTSGLVVPATDGVQYVYVDESTTTPQAHERTEDRYEHEEHDEEDDDD